MNGREPNAFQREALRKTREELRLPDDHAPTLTWEEGVRECYWRLTWRKDDETIEAYIYSDEAGIMRNGKDWTIFESPDYRLPSDLLAAFVARLRQMVDSARMDVTHES